LTINTNTFISAKNPHKTVVFTNSEMA